MIFGKEDMLLVLKKGDISTIPSGPKVKWIYILHDFEPLLEYEKRVFFFERWSSCDIAVEEVLINYYSLH